MNGVELIEAHGKLVDAIQDTDSAESFQIGESPVQTAQKISERADHLANIMAAVDGYVERLVLDCAYHTGFPTFLHSEALDRRFEAMKTLESELRKHAERTCPTAVLERDIAKTVSRR